MDTIPEWQDYETQTDPKTGITSRFRKQARFMVNRSDVLFYTDLVDGTRWQVLTDADGKEWKQRFY